MYQRESEKTREEKLSAEKNNPRSGSSTFSVKCSSLPDATGTALFGSFRRLFVFAEQTADRLLHSTLHLSYSYVTTVFQYFTHLEETGSNSDSVLDVPLSVF